MVRTTNQSLETVPGWAGNAQLTNLSNLMSLGADTKLLELCDEQDVMITVLEGHGNLTLNQEITPLEPGRFIFIPAQMPHTLQTQTSLVFLLSRCESNSGLPETAWAITL